MSNTASLACDRPHASIVVTCKGRLSHLRRTLPCMLTQDCRLTYEVIVVDFGCPQGTYDWCAGLDVENLVSVKVLDDTGDFHLSRARNCGANVARGRVLGFVDADVFLDATWLDTATGAIGDGRAGLCTVAGGFQRTWGRWGTCAVVAEIYHAVRGYDEALRGWGGDDIDFYSRVESRTTRVGYPGFLVTPIDHGDDERVRYQASDTIEASNAYNSAYLSCRRGLVNAEGYGRGELMVFRGRGETLPPVTWTRRQRVIPRLRRHAAAGRNGSS